MVFDFVNLYRLLILPKYSS